MKGSRAIAANEEPMGIVISRGAQAEQTPRFAYVWGPAPEPTEVEQPKSKVA